MLQQGILPYLCIQGEKLFRLLFSEMNKMKMNKKNCMVGDCRVWCFERLIMHFFCLLVDYKGC